MKKLYICICILLCFLLCSCSPAAEYREPEQVVITAALGFDNEEGRLILSAETINTSGEGDYTPKVLKGSGHTTEQVIQSISHNIGGKLFLGHLATVVLGKTLTQDQTEDILEFCREDSEISPAVRLVSTENAAGLLSCKGVSGEAVGYDIVTLITTKEDLRRDDNYATLFNIEKIRSEKNNCYTLPCFSVMEEKEPLLFLDGSEVFSGTLRIYTLENEQDTLLRILENKFQGGTLTLLNGGDVLQADIEKIRTTMDTTFSDNSLSVSYFLKLTLKKNGFKGESVSAFTKALEERLKKLLTLLQTEIKEDLLHITDNIKRYKPLIYKKLETNPLDAFCKADISVTCTAREGDGQ